jgi:hypothetical protein
MEPIKALASAATIAVVLALIVGSSGIEAQDKWPIDATYYVAAPTFADVAGPISSTVHRFTGTSWENWEDEVIAGADVGFCERVVEGDHQMSVSGNFGCDDAGLSSEPRTEGYIVVPNSFLRPSLTATASEDELVQDLSEVSVIDIPALLAQTGFSESEIVVYRFTQTATCAQYELSGCDEAQRPLDDVTVTVVHEDSGWPLALVNYLGEHLMMEARMIALDFGAE